MELKTSPQLLRFARHIVGMAILSAANPLIYYSSNKATTWAATLIAPLLIAAVIFTLYALFFTNRAKAEWPKSFLVMAWVFLAIVVAQPYMENFQNKQAASRQQSQVANEHSGQFEPFNGTLDGEKPQSPGLPSPAKDPILSQPNADFAPRPALQLVEPVQESRVAYVSRVAALRRASEAGNLPVVQTREVIDSDRNLVPWPATDVAAIEGEQTWWIQENRVFIHITNRSKLKMDAIRFEYAPRPCSAKSSAETASYGIHLQRPIAPGNEALVVFSAENLTVVTNACLIIAEIVG